MTWRSVESIEMLAPIMGPLAVILLGLLVWEKRERGETRKALSDCQNKRVDEAMKMTKVIEASSAAADARTDATREQSEVYRSLTTVVPMTVAHARGGACCGPC